MKGNGITMSVLCQGFWSVFFIRLLPVLHEGMDDLRVDYPHLDRKGHELNIRLTMSEMMEIS